VSIQEQTLLSLRAIEKKHKVYFDLHKLDIVSCVTIIDDGRYISVHHLNQDLPFDIKHDIESLFWLWTNIRRARATNQ
jgi:hypothetical protein